MTSRSVARNRGRALYRDASRATYVLGPPPSRSSGGDLELAESICPCENMAYVVHGTLTWSGV